MRAWGACSRNSPQSYPQLLGISLRHPSGAKKLLQHSTHSVVIGGTGALPGAVHGPHGRAHVHAGNAQLGGQDGADGAAAGQVGPVGVLLAGGGSEGETVAVSVGIEVETRACGERSSSSRRQAARKATKPASPVPLIKCLLFILSYCSKF